MPGSGERPIRRGDIAAVSVGNALDWFEIVVYGYFAGVISTLFFPAETPGISLLLTFLTFGVTFVIRPLGAVVLGGYADRHGRKSAIQLSIVMMAGASAAIALVPTYQSIGILAPCILVGARMVQGFAVGGEFGSATAFLAETDSARRGYFASWQFASQGFAGVLATGFGFVIAAKLSDEQIHSWGWRLPFLFGLLIAPVGYYIRGRLIETMDFTIAQTAGSPIASIFAEHKQRLLVATGLIVLGSVATYTIVFMPTFAAHNLRLTASNSFAAALLTASIQAVAGRLERKAWPYVICGLLCLIATGGIVFTSGAWIVVAAAIVGFAAAAILILVLALPPLLSPPDDVHRVTAAMFTISYSCAVIVPVISGALWDFSGIASMAFLPIALCGILLVILAPAINHVPRTGS